MKILITGGAGFIGSNSAVYFAEQGNDVVIFDNLSRKGSEKNLKWIKDKCSVSFIEGDLRNYEDLVSAVKKEGPYDLVLHLAAQVAVTTSVTDPRSDFEINALGTFNLLEVIRQYSSNSVIIYSSTNKVYGEMKDLNIVERDGRYIYQNLAEGVDEKRNLDFHSPYGCSKGSADQYCMDYFRIYGLKTIVLRQSCIYGYRQFGVEDQGWVAWFSIAAVLEKQITIYGDGMQVRDVLFIDDLVHAFELAYANSKSIAGEVFNIGGGPKNILSLLDLVYLLEKKLGKKIPIKYSDWRPGDQKAYIGNVSYAERKFGWHPIVTPIKGVDKLLDWIIENKESFEE